MEIEFFNFGTKPEEKIKEELKEWLNKTRPHIVRVIRKDAFNFLIFYDYSGGIITNDVEIFEASYSIEKIRKWLKTENPKITADLALNNLLFLFYYKHLENLEGYKASDDLRGLPHPGE